MRTIGFVLVILGAAIIYLGWNGKIGRAFTALITGSDPGDSSSNGTGLTWKAPSQVIETQRSQAKKAVDKQKTDQSTKSLEKKMVDNFYGQPDA